jgi:DNA-directed RNA polymerase specialized sigma24 family protein
MTLHHDYSDPHECERGDDSAWSKLYSFLKSRVRQWIHFSHISSWLGQEEDIVDDIVQEAITRTLNYARRAEMGEVPAIDSLEGLCLVIARNYYEDLRRHDCRFVRFTQLNTSSEAQLTIYDQVDPSEIALENMIRERIFVNLSHEIAKLPVKQRTALLTDLANLMCFALQPTPLQKALLERGLQPQDYKQSLPKDTKIRSRHAANLSIAYKRLRKLAI